MTVVESMVRHGVGDPNAPRGSLPRPGLARRLTADNEKKGGDHVAASLLVAGVE
jgi:hypothetical protein